MALNVGGHHVKHSLIYHFYVIFIEITIFSKFSHFILFIYFFGEKLRLERFMLDL
jgi:hypothetical protein